MARLTMSNVQRATDANGAAENAAKRYIYDAGTTDIASAYSDEGLTTAQANPLTSDSSGVFAQSYLPDGSYKVVVKDSAGVTLYSEDNVTLQSQPTVSYTKGFNTVALLLADTTLSYSSGSGVVVAEDDYVVVAAGGHGYKVAASAASDHHVSTAGGVKLYVLPDAEGRYNIEAFGASSGSNSSTAIGAALDAMEANDAPIYIPAGDFYIDTAVQKTWSGLVRGGIIGAGKGCSRLLVRNNTGGIIMEVTDDRNNEMTFRDFTMLPSSATGGTGLQFKQPQGGAQHRATVTVENVAIGYGTDVTNYFDYYLRLQGCWHSNIENTILDAPWISGGTLLDNSDASAKYNPTIMLDLEGAYGPQIHRARVYGGQTGINLKEYVGAITGVTDNGDGTVRVTVSNAHPFFTGTSVTIYGTTSYNGSETVTRVSTTQFDITATYVASETGSVVEDSSPESVKITHSDIVGSKTGIDHFRYTSREPRFNMSHCHVNYRDNGLVIDGANQVHVTHCAFFNEDDEQEYTGTPYDVWFKNVEESFVTENNFHFVTTNPDRVNIRMDDDGSAESGEDTIIANNLFESGGTSAVVLGSGTQRVVCTRNRVTGTYSGTTFSDSGTNNFVQTDDYGAVVKTWTPTVTFNGGTDPTLSSATGEMIVTEGGVAHVHIDIAFSANGSGAGTVDIDLPATPGPWDVHVDEGAVQFVKYSNMASMSSPIARPVSATALRLVQQGTTGMTAMTDTNFSNTSTLTLSGTLHLTA